MKEEWIVGRRKRGKETGRRGGKGNYDQLAIYERIHKNIHFKIKTRISLFLALSTVYSHLLSREATLFI